MATVLDNIDARMTMLTVAVEALRPIIDFHERLATATEPVPTVMQAVAKAMAPEVVENLAKYWVAKEKRAALMEEGEHL